MAYVEPIVMVYQEYDTLSTSTVTASLPACIIGPCYHVVDPEDDATLALVGTYTYAGLEDTLFPNNVAGALIDESSVSFLFKNPVITLATAYDDNGYEVGVEIQSTQTTSVIVNTDDIPDNIAIGDTVRFRKLNSTYDADSDDYTYEIDVYATDYRVIDIVESTTEVTTESTDDDGNTTSTTDEVSLTQLSLNRTVPDLSDYDHIVVYRNGDDFTLSYDSDYVSIDTEAETFEVIGVKTDIDGTDCTVYSAELYVGYKALRQDLCSVNSIASTDELESTLGSVSTANPLAYGVNIALSNTDTTVYAIGVESDDLVGYNEAIDRLSEYSPMYALAPLTQSTSILSAFKSHVESMSESDVGQWRIAIGSTPLVTEGTRVQSYHTNEDDEVEIDSTGKISANGSGQMVVFTDSDGEFLTAGVSAGDYLELTLADDSTYRFTIAEVTSDDILTVSPSTPFQVNQTEDNGAYKTDSDGVTYLYDYVTDDDGNEIVVEEGTAYAYQIVYDMDKSAIASDIAATSESFGSSRFVHVWPPICVIDDMELPGYYLCCAVAGAVSGLKPHYGMTRTSLAGIDSVKYSNDYFNREQLNTIAGGGTFIFVQSSPTAVPHIRHQLTTDMSSTEFQELSFVKNFDYVCYILKDVLDEYIGTWNITDEALEAIATAINGTLETLRLDVTAKIGSPVISYDLVSVEQLEDTRDRVEAYVDVTFPYPLNTIGLHIVSQ